MSNDYRGESRRKPPLERYGTPGTQYPTANPYDIVITEEVVNRENVFEPVIYGTPHPTVAAALLCYQSPVKSNNQDKAPIRIYANPRLAQEPYNLVNEQDDANDPDFPSFTRSYLLPRGYTHATPGTALSALTGLILGSGGTGYAAGNVTPGYGKVALIFSGGTGTGAAGFAEVVAGVVVAVVLTAPGVYTAVPTATAAGGSGFSALGTLQPTTALLTSEVEHPAEDPYGGYYVRVTRTWGTFPGFESIKPGFESVTGALTRTTTQKTAAPGTPVPRGTLRVFDGTNFYAVDSYWVPDPASGGTFGTLVTEWMEIPPDRIELSSEKSVCPALFVFITGWDVPTTTGFVLGGPFAGVNYTLTAKRTAVAVTTAISYTLGPSGVALPALWNVVSPGAASKFFPISGDTIHNAIFLTETAPGPMTQTIEDLPASAPTSYTPGQDMIIHASEEDWSRATIFKEKRITTAVEPT